MSGQYIGCLTCGVKDIAVRSPGFLDRMNQAFANEAHRMKDWFYQLEVDGYNLFAVDNGEDGYTVMLPDEY